MGLVGVIAAILAAVLVAAFLVVLYLLWVSFRIRRRAERLVPPPGRFVTVDGNRIHYFERGDGPPILMVHGLGGTQFHFAPLIAGLERDFRVVAVDRPGSGYSTRRGDKPGSPIEQAAFLTRFMDAVGLDRPLVVGHSLGGAVSLALALDHPDRVAGLVLISPLTQHDARPVPPAFAPLNLRKPWLRRLIAETVSAPNAMKLAPQTLDFVFGPQQPPADYAIAGGGMAALRPSHFYAASTDFVAIRNTMRRLQSRYGELAMPVGLAFGTADRVIDAERQGRPLQGQIAGLDAVFLDGVGHMPQYSHAAEIVALIRRVAAKAFAGGAAGGSAGG